ncbi:MAG: MBG domain-containing protein, partial [Sphingorhabdus sp.]
TLTGALATSAGVISNVGSYAITQGTLTASSNYALTYAGADLTITPRPLNISANAAFRLFGFANPPLTYVLAGAGLVNNDTLTGVLATTAGLASPPGVYAITQGSVVATPNYSIAYLGANLTVTPVAGQSISRVVGREEQGAGAEHAPPDGWASDSGVGYRNDRTSGGPDLNPISLIINFGSILQGNFNSLSSEGHMGERQLPDCQTGERKSNGNCQGSQQ